MKMLVIMHSSNLIYGAGRSLLTWLDKSRIEYDLLLKKSFNKKVDLQKIEQLHVRPGKIMYAWLPFDICYMGKEDMSFEGKIYTLFTNVLYLCNKHKMDILLNGYSYIYLNSLVLWPLISLNHTFFCHVREVFKGNNKKYFAVVKALSKTKGCIFIDQATYKPFCKEDINAIVINNPFDMTYVDNINKKLVLKKLGIFEDEIVFSIFGRITEFKGVDFVAEAFAKSGVDAVLLIAGDDHSAYAQKIKRKYEEFKNIYWLGEWEKINELFAITDYIVRGEREACVGRTIFEGLYSGTGVIIPGNSETVFINMENDINDMRNRIFEYTPRNLNSLIHTFKKLGNKKIQDKHTNSNVDRYVDTLFEFIEGKV